MPQILRTTALEKLRVSHADSFEGALFKSIRHRAFLAWVLGLLGLAALGILATGLVGLLAMSVTHRMRELGVRIALGATDWRIIRMLVGGQLRLIASGLAVGAVVALWTSRLLRSHLYGISPYEVSVWAAVAVTVGVTAVAGTVIPALRIVASDPAKSLRGD
jgi:ABC-type antimicrobial peptide transport system permease subunit